jgi:stress response protein YsnF
MRSLRKNTGASGAKTDVRDSLQGAWTQIEEIRAQMKRREKGGVDKQPVVKEGLRVHKDVVEDEELVEKDVRKEKVDVDDQPLRVV